MYGKESRKCTEKKVENVRKKSRKCTEKKVENVQKRKEMYRPTERKTVCAVSNLQATKQNFL